MATEAQLIAGLHAADAAGNTADAQHFADQIRAMRASASSAPQTTLGGLAKSIVTRTAQAVTGAAGMGMDAVNALTGDPRDIYNAVAEARGKPTVNFPSNTQLLDKAVSAPTGGYYEPKTPTEENVGTIGSFLPAAFLGPEGLAARIASVVGPTLGTDIGGAVTKGTPYQQEGKFVGGLLGGGFSGVRGRAPELPSMLGDVTPETADLFQKMKALGVNVRPAQASSPGFIRTADDQLQRLPLTGYGGDLAKNRQQVQQATEAALRTTGSAATKTTDAAMAEIKTRLGKNYDTVFGRNSITLTPDVLQKLDAIGTNAQDQLLEGRDKPITDTIQKIKDKAGATGNVAPGSKGQGGVLTGSQYQAMRQTGGPIYQIAKSQDPSIAMHGKALRSTLDQAFQDQANPNDAALLKQTNAQYQNYKILQPLAAKAAVGELSPQLLLSQVNKHGGSGDILDLARGSQAFLKEPANSMTGERAGVLHSLTRPAALATGLAGVGTAGAAAGGIGGAIASLPLAVVTARIMKNLANSKAAERQLMGGRATPLLSYTNPYPARLGLFGRGP